MGEIQACDGGSVDIIGESNLRLEVYWMNLVHRNFGHAIWDVLGIL